MPPPGIVMYVLVALLACRSTAAPCKDPDMKILSTVRFQIGDMECFRECNGSAPDRFLPCYSKCMTDNRLYTLFSKSCRQCTNQRAVCYFDCNFPEINQTICCETCDAQLTQCASGSASNAALLSPVRPKPVQNRAPSPLYL
ncbi:TNFR-Cys domain-containing protein [Plasmodiophora brassicae]